MGKKEYRRVYHGLPKTIIDDHTVFYASFDGTLIPEIGKSDCKFTDPKFSNSVTGHGLSNERFVVGNRFNGFFETLEEFTIDLFLDTSTITEYINDIKEHYGFYSGFNGKNKLCLLSWENSDNKQIRLRFYDDNGNVVYKSMIPVSSLILHIRVTYRSGLLKYYINGNEVLTYDKFKELKLDFIRINQMQCIISDLHISNIDRGDYFPNLPQDFIDGKAIIKPRFGQQQIKGDPLYSQYTLLKVPCNSDGVTYSNFNSSTGLEQSVDRPELFTSNSIDWRNGSKICIKGLNNEIISGVIDSDTALCIVTKDVYVEGNTCTIEVDSTAKLSVNDNLRLIDTLRNPINYGNNIYTVTSKTDNSFTARINQSINKVLVNAGKSFIEVSASSSSPLVKTEDGIVVNGTWAGLGTDEAIFTLGDNTNISGKNLYVEYSLTMIDNSDFIDLPQSIESITNYSLVKMVKTDEFIISDDFLGRTKSNNIVCPSSAHRIISTGTDLSNISAISAANEISSEHYSKISKDDNLTNINYSLVDINKKNQVICKFNILEIIERKLGKPIPHYDKIQWIKDNLKLLTFYVNASGNGVEPVKIVPFCYAKNMWYTGMRVYNGVNMHTLVLPLQNTSPDYFSNKAIDDDGNVYLNIFSEHLTTSGSSTLLNISYVKIEVTLHHDTLFDLYYTDNIRAREDSCIPMLYQKDTKTMKGYIPIFEPLVTEYKYNEFKGVNGKLTPFEEILYSNSIMINSMGTGKYISLNINYKCSLAYITKQKVSQYTSESINNDITKLYVTSQSSQFSGIKFIPRSNTYMNLLYGYIIDNNDVDANNFMTIYPYIKNNNGMLSLGVTTSIFNNRRYITAENIDFPIPNNPIIK